MIEIIEGVDDGFSARRFLSRQRSLAGGSEPNSQAAIEVTVATTAAAAIDVAVAGEVDAVDSSATSSDEA